MTIQVTIHEAKTHLSQLIQRALAGDEVIIAKGKKPMVKLVIMPELRLQRRLGGSPNLVKYIADDFDASLDIFADYMSWQCHGNVMTMS